MGASVLAAVVLAACTTPPPPPPPPASLEAADPDPARVEALLVLVGDGGDALPGQSPVLASVSGDVARWAPQLREGAVRVILLGDVVYDEGVHPPDNPRHARDTLRLRAQLEPVLTAGARASGARLDVVAGNHDWGGQGGAEGLARLENLAAHVQGWQSAGLPVALRPGAGELAPEIVDVGSAHRLLYLDTQAWLYADEAARGQATDHLAEALTGAGNRTVTVLAHHPLVSGGEHGLTPPTDDVGDALRSLVARTGILIQDAWSGPYQAFIGHMRAGMGRVPRAPLIWASGHDHSLQLLAGTASGDPRYTVVAGSASRLGDVAAAPGMIFGGAWPGYGRLFLLDDGSAVLQLVAGAPASAHCPQPDSTGRAACMASGTSSFHTVLSRRLR